MNNDQLNHINRLLQLAAEDIREEVIANALFEYTNHFDHTSLTKPEAMR